MFFEISSFYREEKIRLSAARFLWIRCEREADHPLEKLEA